MYMQTHTGCSNLLLSVCIVTQSYVQLFATPWTVAHQDPLPMGILQAGILEWVGMLSPRASSQPRDQTQSPALQKDSFFFFLQKDSLPSEPPGEPIS